MTGERSTLYRALAPQAFRALGLHALAYIKPTVADGKAAYAIHTADGNEVALFADRATALATVIGNDLTPASVH